MIKIILALFISLSAWAGIGNIMALKGEATIERASKSIHATSGAELLEGDTILTKAKTRLQVMLTDGTVVTIGPNSSFSFDEFSFDGTKNSKLSMRAERGFFRSVTGKLGKIAPERFKVKTASATIGIRGTDFSAEISQDKEIIKCYSGAIFVDFKGEFNEVDAGSMIELSPQGMGLKHSFSKNTPIKRSMRAFQQEEQKQEGKISEGELGEITQQAQPQDNGEQYNQKPETNDPTVDEPFYITPITEDRPQQY